VALQVRDMEQSIAFYQRYCSMRIVHDRTDEFRVVWLGWGEDPPRFVIVLLAQDYELNRQPPFQHLGIALPRREDVDVWAGGGGGGGYPAACRPGEGGPVVGYFCGLIDPDGNTIEFSHGQRLG
jgi:catechol 2,3-dioxygenase-like lactoylglutathione lyase family enzyme